MWKSRSVSFRARDTGPLAAAVLAFLCVGLMVTGWPSLRFAGSDTDYLSLLLARGFFHDVLAPQGLAECLPLQNGNLLAVGLIRLASTIPLDPGILLRIGQALLGALLVSRVSLLALRWIPRENRRFFGALAMVHPVVWLTVCRAPVEALTIVLFIDTLARYPRTDDTAPLWPVSLFLLSFSGLAGFTLALLLTFSMPWGQGTAGTEDDESPGSWRATLVLSLGAILPAVFFYVVLTLQWGTLGGPRLAGFPNLFADITVEKILDGLWTRRVQDWLLWAGNGFVNLPAFIPLFGLLFFLGIAAAWQDGPGARGLALMAGWFFSLAAGWFAFTSPGSARQSAFALYFWALIFVIRGARWLVDQFGVADPRAAAVPVFLLAGFSITAAPGEWESVATRARYYRQVVEAVEKTLEDLANSGPAAVRFSPAVFALAGTASGPAPFPADLTLELAAQDPRDKQEGIRFDIRRSPTPARVIFYPFLEEQPRPSESFLETGPLSRWQTALSPFYRHSRIFNLEVYDRTARNEIIAARWADDLRREGPPDPFSGVSEQDLEQPETVLPPPKSPGPPPSTPVGRRWDFEEGYQFIRWTGFAFGFHPPVLPAASGLRGVVSGTDETAGLLGILRSEPFLIEGDEMTFVAALPEDSTSAYFALAIYLEAPFGENREIQQTRHLFEYEPPAPLMPDTFYYVLPSNLRYTENTVTGWRVVRLLQQTPGSRPRWVRWSLDPWVNRQAVWLAADRDRSHFLFFDQITQWKRPPGLYFNFESGNYGDWETSGEAFGSRPANGPWVSQRTIQGYEGNFLINSFYEGSDRPTGSLISPSFIIPGNRLDFFIGGGDDLDTLYLALRVGNQEVLRETGNRSETLHPVSWDVTPWAGKQARIQIVDRSSDPWGHILVDDIRLYAREVESASRSQ
ncbi:MAG: hypothetical protein ACE15F_03795 [bacterium]